MKILIRLVFLPILLLSVGCEVPFSRRNYPEMTFTHLPPISLDVARIDVIQLFEPAIRPPNIEHKMPLAPHIAISRWVSDRLKSTGTSGKAIVTIRDASVTEERLKAIGGIWNALKIKQSERYVGRIEVEIEAIGGKGLRAASAIAKTQRSRSIIEDSTMRQREVLWFEMTERMMQDFDRTLEAQIRQHLTAFLK